MSAEPQPLELVPEPASGRVHEAAIRPGVADVTGGGRARIDAIARWLAEVAREDLEDAGFEGRGVWIIRRTRIRVESFPRYEDRVVLRTFCSGIGRFSAERRTVISGGSARVDAVSRWICLDPTGSRPQRFDDDFRRAYAQTAGERGANVRVRHPDPPADASAEPWSFRATDIDIAGHVNNSHYWAPVEQGFLAGGEPAGFDGELEHREPAGAGPVELLRSGEWTWIAAPGGELHASIRVTGSDGTGQVARN